MDELSGDTFNPISVSPDGNLLVRYVGYTAELRNSTQYQAR
jgi:hypothetical protein